MAPPESSRDQRKTLLKLSSCPVSDFQLPDSENVIVPASSLATTTDPLPVPFQPESFAERAMNRSLLISESLCHASIAIRSDSSPHNAAGEQRPK